MKALLRGVICGAALVFTSAANADSIHIDWAGGPLVLHSGGLTGTFDGSGPGWSAGSLIGVHEQLHADGVSTDGVVTFLLAETDAGLAFMALVDDRSIGGPRTVDSALGFETSAPSSSDFFINGPNDLGSLTNSGDGQSATGEFHWSSAGHGDAVAWAGLGEGDSVDMAFMDAGPAGLNGSDTFQFVSFDGEAWHVVTTGSFGDGVFAISGTVVPLPAAFVLGIAGLAGVAVVRRRRTTTA